MVRLFAIGEEAEVLAVDTSGLYYMLENPQNTLRKCWVFNELGTLSGDIDSVPAFTPQPTP
jgi:hypothetical protein